MDVQGIGQAVAGKLRVATYIHRNKMDTSQPERNICNWVGAHSQINMHRCAQTKIQAQIYIHTCTHTHTHTHTHISTPSPQPTTSVLTYMQSFKKIFLSYFPLLELPVIEFTESLVSFFYLLSVVSLTLLFPCRQRRNLARKLV